MHSSGKNKSLGKNQSVKWNFRISLTVSFLHVLSLKALLIYNEMCKHLETVFCPAPQNYDCVVANLNGTRKIWGEVYQSFTREAILIFAQELFPVLFVLHALAAQGPSQPALDHKMSIGVVSLNDASPTQHLPTFMTRVGSMCAIVTILLTFARTMIRFNIAVNYDTHPKCDLADFTAHVLAFLPVCLFHLGAIYFVQLGTQEEKKNTESVERKHHAKSDAKILVASAIGTTIKLVIQCAAIPSWFDDNQQKCTAYNYGECASKALTMGYIWLQVILVYKLLVLTDDCLKRFGCFGPVLTITGFVMNALVLSQAYMKGELEYYKLQHIASDYPKTTLVFLIFEQLVYPFNYLFCFTAAVCWLVITERYLTMGKFSVGKNID